MRGSMQRLFRSFRSPASTSAKAWSPMPSQPASMPSLSAILELTLRKAEKRTCMTQPRLAHSLAMNMSTAVLNCSA